MSQELRPDRYYRATYYVDGKEYELRGAYKGLITWKHLPEHKYRAPTPEAGPDVEFHWFLTDDGMVSVHPDQLGPFEEETHDTGY